MISAAGAGAKSSEIGNPRKNNGKLLMAGFLGGFLQAGLFNPWDRALYLSIKEDRHFLHPKNFHNPFAGVSQTIIQRAISAGMYFPLEEIFADKIVNSGVYGSSSTELLKNRTWIALSAGLLAGATNGLLMNPLAAVKYHFWGEQSAAVVAQNVNQSFTKGNSFLRTATEMYQRVGPRIFFVGALATVIRDLVFGAIYGVLRHEMRWPAAIVNFGASSSSSSSGAGSNVSNHMNGATASSAGGTFGTRLDRDRDRERDKAAHVDSREVFTKPTFMKNLIAASIATVCSAPWNYIRNVQYGTPLGQQPKSAVTIMKQLATEVRQEQSLLLRIRWLLIQLRVGWGTARVGCGMAFSSQVYGALSRALDA